MSNLVKSKVRRRPNLLWDTAIEEAKQQLALARRRVEGLQQAVANWTKLRDEGIPWPGTQVTDHNSKQHHSV
jgi:hypothetical protein